MCDPVDAGLPWLIWIDLGVFRARWLFLRRSVSAHRTDLRLHRSPDGGVRGRAGLHRADSVRVHDWSPPLNLGRPLSFALEKVGVRRRRGGERILALRDEPLGVFSCLCVPLIWKGRYVRAGGVMVRVGGTGVVGAVAFVWGVGRFVRVDRFGRGRWSLLSCTGWGGLCFRVGFFVGIVGVGWSFRGTKAAVGSGG